MDILDVGNALESFHVAEMVDVSSIGYAYRLLFRVKNDRLWVGIMSGLLELTGKTAERSINEIIDRPTSGIIVCKEQFRVGSRILDGWELIVPDEPHELDIMDLWIKRTRASLPEDMRKAPVGRVPLVATRPYAGVNVRRVAPHTEGER